MNTRHATFVLSAASDSDFPVTGLPEVAFVGRSNVGKSSLINALTKQKVARTSAAPGKTRLANYYLIAPAGQGREPDFYLVDLPGYGYARGGAESVEAFEALTQAYFEPAPDSVRRLAGVLHLIDSRHPALPQDAAAFAWLLRTGLPVGIVATKIDKLKRSEQVTTISRLERQYGAAVFPSSAPNGDGLAAIWSEIRSWADAARKGD